jgi:hypothetical protein
VSIIVSLEEEWLAGAQEAQGLRGLRNLPEQESRNIVCSTKQKTQTAGTVYTRCYRGLHKECFPKHRCQLQKVRMHCIYMIWHSSRPGSSSCIKLI